MIPAVLATGPYSEFALVIAFVAFLALLIEVIWVRRPADLRHDLHLPLAEQQPAMKGADRDGE